MNAPQSAVGEVLALRSGEIAARRAVAEEISAQHGPNYADTDVSPTDAFDLPRVFEALGIQPGEWRYMVVFTSVRKIDSDDETLTIVDEAAYQEADTQVEGGLEFYFRGEAVDRKARSYCIWLSRAQAGAASTKPKHIEAVAQAPLNYEPPEDGKSWAAGYWAFMTEDGRVILLRPGEMDAVSNAQVEAIDRHALADIRAKRELLGAAATKHTVE
ncbi:MAG TPA: hypothetical protein VLG47_02095 [Candidatus Saccharimonadales bacterium]|nr:hypothetical protein [Candidatus Saccharimonadales bacterium]